MTGRWPVGIKPMLPAGSYVTSLGVFTLLYVDINRGNARVFCSPGFYLRNTTSLRKKEKMAMLRINVCMNIIFIVSDIYAHFLIPKITLNSLGHCLKYTFVMWAKLCCQWRLSTYTSYKTGNIQVALFRKK